MNGIEHGGLDGAYAVVHDFSTNANPLCPPEAVMAAVQCAERHRCPDPDYAALREQLAAWHGVSSRRVLPTAGTSEAILHEPGWVKDPAVVPFWLVRPPQQGTALAQRLAQMRLEGIKLRAAGSLGRPGWLRVSAQAPDAQQALASAWRRGAEAAP